MAAGIGIIIPTICRELRPLEAALRRPGLSAEEAAALANRIGILLAWLEESAWRVQQDSESSDLSIG